MRSAPVVDDRSRPTGIKNPLYAGFFKLITKQAGKAGLLSVNQVELYDVPLFWRIRPSGNLTVRDQLHFVKCFQFAFVADFDSCVYFLDGRRIIERQAFFLVITTAFSD